VSKQEEKGVKRMWDSSGRRRLEGNPLVVVLRLFTEDMRQEKELLKLQRQNMDKERSMLKKMMEGLPTTTTTPSRNTLSDLTNLPRFCGNSPGWSPITSASPLITNKRFLPELMSSPILKLGGLKCALPL